MIVRCPECSTGFKLPDERVTSSGVKLRCSKCSHVFRIRRTDDGDTEIFYQDADRQENAPAGGHDVDADFGNTTQFGMPHSVAEDDDAGDDQPAEAPADAEPEELQAPAAAAPASPARPKAASSSPGYNPFPHANVDLKPKKGGKLSSLSSSSKLEPSDAGSADDAKAGGEGSTAMFSGKALEEGAAREAQMAAGRAQQADEGVDLFDEEPTVATAPDADPFEGAFEDEETPDPQPPAPQRPGPKLAAAADRSAEAASAAAGRAAAAEQDVPVDDDSAFWSQQQSAEYGASEDMVDPSFGTDGPYFDSEKGVVDAPAQPAQQPAQPAAGSQKANGVSAQAAAKPAATPAPRPGPDAAVNRAKSAEPASPARRPEPTATKPADAESMAAQTSRAAAARSGTWEVDDIEPHQIGGSGMQKFANFLLILFIVVAAFLGAVAALSGGFIDFARFGHTLEVAFEGAEFEPRAEWKVQAAPAVAPPEKPIDFEGVWATPLGVGEDKQPVIVLRGVARNVSETDYRDVTVRGLILDGVGKRITEVTGPLGADISREQLRSVGSPAEAKALLSEGHTDLAAHDTEPFTLLFTDLPAGLLDREDLRFRVEPATKEPVGQPANQAPQTP